MNITGKLDKIVVSIDKDSLESPLEEMAVSLAFPVKVSDVADIEPLNGFAEVGFLGLQQEMIVVVHQAIGMNDNGKPFNSKSHIFEEFFFVALVLEYLLAPIATVDNMIVGAGIFDT